MPSAAPVPRGPSVMLLGSAAGLLDRAGCPVCRYVDEACEGYLTRFALSGHYDADIMSRLVASRGMCAPHSRRLLAQPGAQTRLTAVYRYILDDATSNLCARPARCPACEQVAAATTRVLAILVDDIVATNWSAYERHGGLCLPHLADIASQRRKPDLHPPIGVMVRRLTCGHASLDLLAGWPGSDASDRAVYRAVLPGQRPHDGRTCSACWAVADTERAMLGHADGAGTGLASLSPSHCLCGPHLRDVTSGAGNDGTSVVRWQADRQAARLAALQADRPRRIGFAHSRWSRYARQVLAAVDCPVCRGSEMAESRELGAVAAKLDGFRPGRRAELALCGRHVSSLHDMDVSAGRAAAEVMRPYASGLRDELRQAFSNQTWLHRSAPQGSEALAWRRAAAFLDGAVLGGCPA